MLCTRHLWENIYFCLVLKILILCQIPNTFQLRNNRTLAELLLDCRVLYKKIFEQFRFFQEKSPTNEITTTAHETKNACYTQLKTNDEISITAR